MGALSVLAVLLLLAAGTTGTYLPPARPTASPTPSPSPSQNPDAACQARFAADGDVGAFVRCLIPELFDGADFSGVATRPVCIASNATRCCAELRAAPGVRVWCVREEFCTVEDFAGCAPLVEYCATYEERARCVVRGGAEVCFAGCVCRVAAAALEPACDERDAVGACVATARERAAEAGAELGGDALAACTQSRSRISCCGYDSLHPAQCRWLQINGECP